eukprot:11094703-Ditylum_brightwellii.AAC.1
MLPFLPRSNFAFKNSFKDLPRFKNWNEDAVSYVLKNHAKTAARIKLIAILKERATTKQFLFSMCVDGAWMMHAKLFVGVGDNYCPEKHLLDRPVLVAYNSTPVGPEMMLNSIPEAGNLRHANKRTCLDREENMSVASRDNLVSARSQFTTPP